MKSPLLWLLGTLCCGWMLCPAVQSQPAPELKLKDVMEHKLVQAQKMLKGLATEDYQAIRKSADKLKELSNTSAWLSRTSPDYLVFTRDFRRHLQTIQKAADARNIDAVTVGYFQLTVSCVQCHRSLRGSEQASLPEVDLGKKIPVQLEPK